MVTTAIYAKVDRNRLRALARSRVVNDLRAELGNYLTIRRAVGFKLRRAELLLSDFVGYLEAAGIDTITTEAAFAWASLPRNGSMAWWSHRLTVVRGFARHMNAIDASHQVPPTGLLPARTHRATP
jgi:hypothetical protein